MTYTSEQVWTAAAVANRINGEYVKYDQMNFDVTPPVITKMNNKALVREVLEGKIDSTPADVEKGIKAREHFRGKVMDILVGKASGFIQSAVNAANKEEFDERKDRLDMAIIASLIQSYEFDMNREVVNDRRRELGATGHVGKPGERIEGDFTILSISYSQKYNCYCVNAEGNNHAFFFFLQQKVDQGKNYKLKGTVKAHRDEGVTQLNRVKVL
jgi:hypothetical protein